MAPANTRKRKSEEIEEPAGAVTPTGSPSHKRMRITLSQKQALIDNLQLEITERARQLRAGYALQCADLRSRIERRVNRIPLSLRKMTMGELMAQYDNNAPKPPRSPVKQSTTTTLIKDRPLPPFPHQQQHKPTSPMRPQPTAAPAAARGKKRKSSSIRIASDKENENGGMYNQDTLPVQKNTKRTKTAATTTAKPTNTKATSVLSPRSHNSRTLPRSPIKEYPVNTSPVKNSMIARPTSPLKPASPFKTAATAVSSSMHGMYEQAKRGATARLNRTASKDKATATAGSTRGAMLPPPRPAPSAPGSPQQRTVSQASNHSTSTDISTASSGTTIVKPKRGARTAATKTTTAKATRTAAATAPKSPPAPAKRGVAKAASAAKTALKRSGTTTATTKKAAAAAAAAEPATGRRVLRKRT